DLTGVRPDQVTLGASAAAEVLRSLAVLADVRRHPLHLAWALRARQRMSPALRGEVDAFGFMLRRPPMFPDILSTVDGWDWAGDLAALRDTPVADVVEPLLATTVARPGPSRRVRLATFRRGEATMREAEERVAEQHPPSTEVLHQLVADPEAARRRFTD